MATEHMSAKQKHALYKPLLVFIANYARAYWSDRYVDWSNLDIFYKMCESHKVLFAWYSDGGCTYKSWKEPTVNLEVSISLADFLTAVESGQKLFRARRGKKCKSLGSSNVPADNYEAGDDGVER